MSFQDRYHREGHYTVAASGEGAKRRVEGVNPIAGFDRSGGRAPTGRG